MKVVGWAVMFGAVMCISWGWKTYAHNPGKLRHDLHQVSVDSSKKIKHELNKPGGFTDTVKDATTNLHGVLAPSAAPAAGHK